jgi:O-succinylbenzoic acid--CoA ligase
VEASIIPDWLYQKRNSTALAVEFADVAWSYQELFTYVSQLAGSLHHELGVNAGDRVAILARDGLVFTTVLHALMQVNAIAVPMNTRLSMVEVGWQLRDAEVRLICADAAHAEFATQVIQSLGNEGMPPRLIILRSDFWKRAAEPVYRTHVDLDQVHAIVYTSGTTGSPKGAMITYGNHLWGAVGSAVRLGLMPGDLWLIPMPLFHVGGLAVLMRSLIYGTGVLIHAQFDAHQVIATLRTQKVTLLSVVAVMLQRILALDSELFPEGVRAVLLGGGPAPRALLEQCVSRRVPVLLSYGLTESNSQAATLTLADSLRKIGSAGQPLFINEIMIDAHGHEQSVNEPGEILLRGPTVVTGYYQRPEATVAAFQGGWLHTGDVGYLDEEGYLYVLDRRQDLIISGGENVYPAEIEAVLHEHDGILDAGAAGVADREYGQVPFAVVSLKYGVTLTEAELRAHCASRLAKYKVPRKIRFANELPRNAAGKLLRRELVKWL